MGFNFNKALKTSLSIGTLGASDFLADAFKQPDDPGKAQLAQVLAELGKAKTANALGYAKAQAQAKKAIPLIQKGYSDASANSLKLAENTKRDVTLNQGAQLADAQQRVDGTGYNNSNLNRLAARGVYGNTARSLSAIDDLFSRHQDALHVGEGEALAGVQGNLAGLTAQGTNQGTGISESIANTIAGVQHVPKKTVWDLLGPVASIGAAFA